jgi:methyl-accepting chemotaxis protein
VFNNIKILHRLAGQLVLMLLLLAAVSWVGLSSTASVNESLRTVYEDRVIPMQQLTAITNDYYQVRIAVVNTVNATDPTVIAAQIGRINELVTAGEKVWQAYLATYLTPDEKILADKAKAAFTAYQSARSEVLAKLTAGDFEGSKALAKSAGAPALATLMTSLGDLSKLQVKVAEQEYGKAKATYASSRTLMLGGLGLAVLTGVAAAWFIGRSITVPLQKIIGVMGALTNGDLKVDVTGSERGDEVGAVAKAVVVFKDSMIEAERLRSEQEVTKQRNDSERRQSMLDLADSFESSVGGVVNGVTSAATQLQSTAQSMAATAEQTSRQSTVVSAASEETTRNVQTVASATEELSASISEITSQVTESSRIVGEAVEQANDTDHKVQGLSEAAQKIGDVVRLINDIAGQTNLLALNATIEAARAGESGKGFAVVASEVKILATQTAKATEEIAAQVRAIQDATMSSAEAIKNITKTINRVNEISTAIASAVEEQGAATQEISRSVQQAAQGTTEVSSNITSVTDAAQQTGTAATEVLSAASELGKNGVLLKTQVEQFLRTIRAS